MYTLERLESRARHNRYRIVAVHASGDEYELALADTHEEAQEIQAEADPLYATPSSGYTHRIDDTRQPATGTNAQANAGTSAGANAGGAHLNRAA